MTNNKLSHKPQAAILLVAAVLSLSFSACKGRTADNMVPSGDTVEVVISQPSVDDNGMDSIEHNDSLQNEI